MKGYKVEVGLEYYDWSVEVEVFAEDVAEAALVAVGLVEGSGDEVAGVVGVVELSEEEVLAGLGPS